MAKKAKTTSTARAAGSSPSAGAKKATKSLKAAPSGKTSSTQVTKASGKAVPSKLPTKAVSSKIETKAPSKTPSKATGKKTVASQAKAIGKPPAVGKTQVKLSKASESVIVEAKGLGPKAIEAAPKKTEKKKTVQETPSVLAKSSKAPKRLSPVEGDEVEGAGVAESDGKGPDKKKKRDEFKIDRAGDLAAQWQALYDRTKATKPVAYKMSDNYEARTPLLHKVLGWGYVLASQNNRLEVLFKDGIKILIANYKGG